MSYTWRSILRGVELLKQGVVWRVGAGENIDAWTDPWIPRGTTRRPLNRRGVALVERVADLINPITEQWDSDLVLDLFGEEDAKHILEIPLRSGMDDQLAWHYDAKGFFQSNRFTILAFPSVMQSKEVTRVHLLYRHNIPRLGSIFGV
jgi:hypothetical protein